MSNKDIKFSQILTMSANGTTPLFANGQVDQRDFMNLALTLVGSNTASFTVKILGSLQKEPVDFSAPSTISNSWGYIQTINYDTGNSVPGSTGYAFVANGTRLIHINTDVLTWIGIEVSGYATGTLNAQFTYANNI